MESNKPKKSWYKKWWVWVIVIIVLIGIGGAAGGGDKSKTTTTTSKPAASTPAPEQPKWDAAAIYPQINAGMTKADAEKVIGKTSNNCSESAIEGYGTTELCVYTGGFGDTGSITITYKDGTVQSKTKTGF
jgi:hypothetical protein